MKKLLFWGGVAAAVYYVLRPKKVEPLPGVEVGDDSVRIDFGELKEYTKEEIEFLISKWREQMAGQPLPEWLTAKAQEYGILR